MNLSFRSLGKHESYVHGCCLILLDGLGITHPIGTLELQRDCFRYLLDQVPKESVQSCKDSLFHSFFSTTTAEMFGSQILPAETDRYFSVGPFSVSKGPHTEKLLQYTLKAPTTSKNVMRLLRGMQLSKPLLLVGFSFYFSFCCIFICFITYIFVFEPLISWNPCPGFFLSVGLIEMLWL